MSRFIIFLLCLAVAGCGQATAIPSWYGKSTAIAPSMAPSPAPVAEPEKTSPPVVLPFETTKKMYEVSEELDKALARDSVPSVVSEKPAPKPKTAEPVDSGKLAAAVADELEKRQKEASKKLRQQYLAQQRRAADYQRRLVAEMAWRSGMRPVVYPVAYPVYWNPNANPWLRWASQANFNAGLYGWRVR